MKKYILLLFLLITVTCAAQTEMTQPFMGGTVPLAATFSGTLGVVGTSTFGARAYFASGTIANPGIAFVGDTGTGFCNRVTWDVEAIAGGHEIFEYGFFGSAYVRFSSDLDSYNVGRFYIRQVNPSGTIPAYSFNSDITTGLGRYAAGQPSMISAGTEAQRWTATGTQIMGGLSALGATFHNANVYWGGPSAAAGSPVILNGGVSGTQPSYAWNGNDTTGLGRYAAGQPSMISAGTEAQRWTATGTQIFGGARVYGSIFATSANGNQQITNESTASNTIVEYALINDLGSGLRSSILLTGSNWSGVEGKNSLTFEQSVSSGSIKFYNYNGVKMTIASSGYVGIGTTIPDQPLTVAGAASISTTLAVGSSFFVTVEGGNAVRFTAGMPLTQGDVLQLASTSSRLVTKSDLNEDMPIGTAYSDLAGSTSIASGSQCWVVTDGIGFVKLDSTAATVPGGVLVCSSAGVASFSTALPSATEHNREVGHNIEAGAANSVIKAILHFN